MKLKKKVKEDPEIDVGAFSDIAFLLIIFFILTTTFVKTAGGKMEIPSGSASQDNKQPKQLTVNLSGDIIQYGEKNENLDIQGLRDRLILEKFAEKPKEERIVVLDSKNDVPYSLYYKVVMAISNSGGVLALVDHSKGGTK